MASSIQRTRIRDAWLCLLPACLVLLTVALWPLVRTVIMGFTDASLADPGGAHFIGLRNYLHRDAQGWSGVLADPDWWRAVGNTMIFSGISVAAESLLGLGIALLLNARLPLRALLRAAVLIPWAIPTVVSAKLWAWLLNEQFGMLNDLLLRLGLIAEPLSWTGSPRLAMASVIAVDVWKATPFVALLLLAALQGVPKECLEAARLDGAGRFLRFRRIVLPFIAAPLAVAVVFRLLDALRVFDVVYVLTANNVHTMTMSIYARLNLVDFLDAGYGSAVSTLLMLLIGLITIAYVRLAGLRL